MRPSPFLDKARAFMAWRGAQSVEFRFLYWLWRALIVITAVLYIGSLAPEAWRWMQTKYVRTQNIDRLDFLLKKAEEKKDTAWVEKWMRMRPNEDSQVLMTRARPYIGLMGPYVPLDFARRADFLKDEDARKFWVVYTHYRLRYDALRCGASDSVESIDRLIRLVANQNQRILRHVKDDEIISYVRRVLKEDETSPARNDPAPICTLVRAVSDYTPIPLPRDEWETVRFDLRFSTDSSIRRAEEELEKKKTAP